MADPRIRAVWGRIALAFAAFLIVSTLFVTLFLSMWPGGPGPVEETPEPIPPDPGFTMALILVQALGGIVTALGASRFLDRRPLADLGWVGGRNPVETVGWGLLLGLVLASATTLFISALGRRHIRPELFAESGPGFLMVILLGIALAGFMEEWLFRGYFFVNLREAYSPGRTVLFTALLFAALHGSNPGGTLLSWANIVLVGVVLGQLRELTGGIQVPFGLHVGWNLALGTVYGVPVSGFSLPSVFRISLEDLPVSLGGGDFGPEGSAVVTVLFGAVAVLLGRRIPAPVDGGRGPVS